MSENTLAIKIESWYLLNLTLMPVLGFFVLIFYYDKYFDKVGALVDNHLVQTLNAALWLGSALVLMSSFVFFVTGINNITGWVIVILYITCIHSIFILLGVIGLVKALAGQFYSFPVVGKVLLIKSE
jgi:hypothetical protein